jgi:RimJ/RimL family protein N-acetyltransferase
MFACPSLTGRLVVLEPLRPDHAPALAAAAGADRSTYGYTRVPDGIDAAAAYVAGARADAEAGRAVPFAVRRRADDTVVGSTRFLDLDVFTWPPPWPPGVPSPVPATRAGAPTVAEIGSTWYAPSAQRTGVNTECKLLLLTHAFDTWGCLRISFKTDARNQPSRRAIERLGAQFEGIRRAHVAAVDGTVRDSAYYSILASEWPVARERLRARLAAGPQPTGAPTGPSVRR